MMEHFDKHFHKVFKTPEEIANDPPEDPTRRDVLEIGLTALAGTLFTKGVLRDVDGAGQARAQEGVEKDRMPEREYSKNLDNRLIGYKKFYGQVKTDEVLFLDEEGLPVGDPVKIAPLGDILPGELDQHGIIKGTLSSQWLNAQRQRLKEQHPKLLVDISNSLPRQMNLIFVARELASVFSSEQIEPNPTYLDVVKHFGSKLVSDGYQETRIGYLRNHISKSAPTLSKVIREELPFVLPGLAAQESKYVANAQSSVGARGILQFMPATWEQMGYKKEDMANFPLQVEAAGKYFSNAYEYIQSNAKITVDRIQQEFFPNDVEAFERYFLTPVLTNCYNSGTQRLIWCMELFLLYYPTKQRFEEIIGTYPEGLGYDLYLELTGLCSSLKTDGNRRVPGYGRDSSQYVARSYALAELLKDVP
jgi:hypothetical protein